MQKLRERLSATGKRATPEKFENISPPDVRCPKPGKRATKL